MSKNDYISNGYKNTHLITIVTLLPKYFLLLLVPLLSNLPNIVNDIMNWIRFLWSELLIMSVILLIALVRWRCIMYKITPEGVVLKSGVFLRKTLIIPFHNISTVILHRSIILTPFNASVLRLDTYGGKKNKHNMKVFISLREEKQFKKELEANNVVYQMKSPNLPLLAVSLSCSNALTGILIATPFVYQATKIVNVQIQNRIYGTVDAISEQYLGKIPYAVRIALLVMAGGWLLAFIVMFVENGRFSVTRRADSIEIKKGLLISSRNYIKMHTVSAIDIRQTLFMSLFRLRTVFIHCLGYGRLPSESSIFIPSATKKDLRPKLEGLVPGMVGCKMTIFPPCRARRKYMFCFVVGFGISATAFLICLALFHNFYSLITIAAGVTAIVYLWYLAVSVMAYTHAGAGCDRNHVVISIRKGLELHRIYITKEKLQKVWITQNPFQVKKDLCNLVVSIMGTEVRRYKVRHLDINEAKLLQSQIIGREI